MFGVCSASRKPRRRRFWRPGVPTAPGPADKLHHFGRRRGAAEPSLGNPPASGGARWITRSLSQRRRRIGAGAQGCGGFRGRPESRRPRYLLSLQQQQHACVAGFGGPPAADRTRRRPDCDTARPLLRGSASPREPSLPSDVCRIWYLAVHPSPPVSALSVRGCLRLPRRHPSASRIRDNKRPRRRCRLRGGSVIIDLMQGCSGLQFAGGTPSARSRSAMRERRGGGAASWP